MFDFELIELIIMRSFVFCNYIICVILNNVWISDGYYFILIDKIGYVLKRWGFLNYC